MILVVKVGGDILVGGPPKGLIGELEELSRDHRLVLVHGGGDIVTEISNRLGHEPRFVTSPRGFRSRYTDKNAIEIYTMVMAGKINKEIVSALQGRGIAAVGLSGLDGGLIKAKRKNKIVVLDERGRRMVIDGGYTGQVEEVNAGLFHILLENGYLPVVSSLAMGEEGEPLNIDGDRAAANVALALGADRLILLTDVEGLNMDGKNIEEMHVSEVREIMERVGAGMITKVYAAVEAVEGGVYEAVIASGFGDAAISRALEHKVGTVIRR